MDSVSATVGHSGTAGLKRRGTKKVMKLIRNFLGPDTRGHEQYLANGGEDYLVDIAPANLLPILLIGKLHEEAEEIRENMTCAEEYADALQALHDLAELNGVAWSEIEFQRGQKVTRKGGFNAGKVLRREP